MPRDQFNFNPPPDAIRFHLTAEERREVRTGPVAHADNMFDNALLSPHVAAPAPSEPRMRDFGAYTSLAILKPWVDAWRAATDIGSREEVTYLFSDRLCGRRDVPAPYATMRVPSSRNRGEKYCGGCSGWRTCFPGYRTHEGAPLTLDWFCFQCIAGSIPCAHCGQTGLRSEVTICSSLNPAGAPACYRCARESVQCNLCDSHFLGLDCPVAHTDDMVPARVCLCCSARGRDHIAVAAGTNPARGGDAHVYVCQRCSQRQVTEVCDRCNGVWRRAHIIMVRMSEHADVDDFFDEGPHAVRMCYTCNRGFDDDLFCGHCQTYFTDAFVFNRHNCREDCECSECSWGRDDDDDGGRGRGGIYPYSYKPAPEFRGDGPVFLGFELEVECQYRASIDRLVSVTYEQLDDGLVYLKDDGSLSHGFEIVSHPLSWDWMRTEFNWAGIDVIAGAGALDASDAGLHVHVSRKGFGGRSHEYRWFKFMYDNRLMVNKLAGRESDQWASWYGGVSAKGGKMKIVKGEQTHSERYQAININNAATYEVRVFASTVNPRLLQARISFVDASVEYTRTLTSAQVCGDKGMKWARFVKWVKDNEGRYAALHSVLSDIV